MSERRFYRTLVVVEVLGESEINFDTLEQLHHAITDGDFSGSWDTSCLEVTENQMADLLEAQGSDPGFLGIHGTCKRCGSDLDEDGYCEDETCPHSDYLQHETWTEG
jgi:hypothetical protein